MSRSPVKYLLGFLVTCMLTMVQSAPVTLFVVKTDVFNQEKLKRGAQIFMNYCSGCHSLHYLRYNRMGKDLGLVNSMGQLDTGSLIRNFIFTQAKIHDPIEISLPAQDARQWFGLVPPDLSLTVRERGAAWVYTYLKSFYSDHSRPFGTNNLVVPDTAMPNVLAPLAGQFSIKNDTLLRVSKKGEYSQQQFNNMLEDLITFLAYTAEPAQLIRYRVGILVIIFLGIFLLVAFLLKRDYWQKIH